jgi:7-cyano-7-deazaguanine synthase
MTISRKPATIGVLASGGLDSCILVGHLLREGRQVQPFYIRTGVVWQEAELEALQGYLAAIASPNLRSLVELDLPLRDVYGSHWSTTGRGTPDSSSPDEDVFLPGRNALLLVKAAVWCQLHEISQLALAPLGSSPFEDASPAFVREFQAAINRGSASAVELLLPFSQMHKRQVMHLGRRLPLELTFSCIRPKNGLHCGECNKCAERRQAFADAGMTDATPYAHVLEAA